MEIKKIEINAKNFSNFRVENFGGGKKPDFTSGIIEYPDIFRTKKINLSEILKEVKTNVSSGNFRNAKESLKNVLNALEKKEPVIIGDNDMRSLRALETTLRSGAGILDNESFRLQSFSPREASDLLADVEKIRKNAF